MNRENDQPARVNSLRIFETGVRVALEEMLTGRNYARVEDILRALADGSSLPATKTDPCLLTSLAGRRSTSEPAPGHKR